MFKFKLPHFGNQRFDPYSIDSSEGGTLAIINGLWYYQLQMKGYFCNSKPLGTTKKAAKKAKSEIKKAVRKNLSHWHSTTPPEMRVPIPYQCERTHA